MIIDVQLPTKNLSCMIQNYLRLALRHLRKHKLYAAVNISGLAVAVAACLLLYRMVQYESGFNRQLPHSERIVRIVTDERDPSGEINNTSGIPIPAMDLMEQTITQFESFARIGEFRPTLVVNGSDSALQKKFQPIESEIAFFAEPEFLDIFDWGWLSGDKSTALQAVNNIVLSKTWAEKCYDRWENALGKSIVMDGNIQLTVSGVMADPPVNCDFPVVALVSYPTLPANASLYNYEKDWGSTSSNNQAFARLKDVSQRAAAEGVLAQVGAKEYVNRGRGDQPSKVHLLQPLSDLHHNELYSHSGSHTTSHNRLYILSCIGVLIMLMAGFNFINLATAQAGTRAREVGVRKALGSGRGQLLRQFMVETALIVVFSVVLGALLAFLASPLLKHISDVPDSWPLFGLPGTWLFLAILTIVVTVLAGFYPALILAGFDPIKALRKDTADRLVGGVSLRKVLVVSQFVIAQCLIVGTLVTINQLEFIQNRDMGFKKDLIYGFQFQNDSITRPKLKTLKTRLQAIAGVESVSFSSDHPASGNTWSSNFALGGNEDAPFNTSMKICDSDYLNTYSLQLVAGQWLTPSDTVLDVVVNETLVHKLGLKPEEAIGKLMRLGGRRQPTVVGVVKDFHTHSLHEALEPITMLSRAFFYGQASIKLQGQQLSGVTGQIERLYNETFPDQVFKGRFYDEDIQNFYEDETRFSATCRGFAGIAILIACLGLLGLATHVAARRTKEIGVRKVLGASVVHLTNLLAVDFLRLVLIAIVLACPIAWYFMHQWLQDFAFHTELSPRLFIIAGATALFIAYLTVAVQSLRASLANPVKSLKSE
jgi:putative ABC transport system permease protein